MHSYSKLFGEREIPSSTLIFTDFDHLHSYEIDAASIAMNAAIEAFPNTKVLNRPQKVHQRTALLSHLRKTGLNDIEVTRIDTGEVPETYPVFIREEDGCGGPETGILQNETEFRAAVQDLTNSGRTLAGRVALSFSAQTDADGFYRKYGAFVIGKRIVPQHILRSTDWVVKSGNKQTSSAFIEEELDYVANNPHEDELRRVADAVNIDYGRIDYGIHDDRIVIFEINTNPTFPNFLFGDPDREARRGIVAQQLTEAFQEIDYSGPVKRIPFTFEHIGNSPFVERESWIHHPYIALRRRGAWNRIINRIRPTELLSSKRWKLALRTRLGGPYFFISRMLREVSRR
ncbi:MAG: hypothetical protein ACR2O1_02835 [Boseongicola sp.]